MTKSEQPASAPLPARQGDTRPLLDRILDTPGLARLVPRLSPQVLHRVVEQCGLEDCGEVVALATPQQLSQVFDIDLWRPDRPGLDEHFDADRFALWLAVLAEHDPAIAAAKLAGMDVDLLVTAFAQHVRVYDPAVLRIETEDGETFEAIHIPDEAPRCEVGGYLIVASREESWDALVEVLSALESGYSKVFNQVMRRCRSLSNSAPEIDGLDDLATDPEQAMFDLAVQREERREQQGYLSPAQARAFLQAARDLDPASPMMPEPSPLARAYFLAVESPQANETQGRGQHEAVDQSAPSAAEHVAHAQVDPIVELLDTLRDAGVVPQAPRALLGPSSKGAARLERMRAGMQAVHERDELAYLRRGEELAYLANTLMAGSPIQGRPMTAQEASDAAVAVCNLGLEHWPSHWSVPAPGATAAGSAVGDRAPDDLLVTCDLVRVFQVGWSVLYRRVCVRAAERLLDVLDRLTHDEADVREGIDALRVELSRGLREGCPWRARDAIDVLAGFDMISWAGLLSVIDEYPVMNAAIRATGDRRVRSVSPSAFEFISEQEQIVMVERFLAALDRSLAP